LQILYQELTPDETSNIVAVFMMIFVCFIPFMVFVFLNYNESKWGEK